MGAAFAGQPFRLDPTSVRWDFNAHTMDKPYIGGKVIQVFGASIGDITVEGAFGVGGIDEQRDFLDRMKKMAQKRVDDARRQPQRFVWPEQRWDFRVYLRSYSDITGRKAVVQSPLNYNPKWRLVLFPVGGTAQLKEASVKTFIQRLSRGMGWRPNRFQGPLTFAELQAAMNGLGAANLEDFFAKSYGAGSVPSNTSPGTTPGIGQQGGEEIPPMGEIQNYAKQKAAGYGWTGHEWNCLVELVTRESSWDPLADNPTSTAFGLFQFLDATWEGYGPKTNDYKLQIEYGLRYIKDRYGSPSAALAFHDANNWY